MVKYFVCYNSKLIASRKTISSCKSYISQKGLKDDEDNSLCIVDNQGFIYDPVSGNLK
jgi:hypothetical protein